MSDTASNADADARSLDSLPNADISSETASLPINSDGYVPKGTSLQVCRSGKRCSYSGMVFMMDSNPCYFAEFRNWVASAKRNEIILHEGSETGREAGGINFHHWLMDQSRSIEITIGDGTAIGEDKTAELTRPHSCAAHAFKLQGKDYIWKELKGEGDQKVKRFYHRHMKCVDLEGTDVAVFYLESYRGKGDERLVGRFEMQQDGFDRDAVEGLLLTFLAVYIKSRKRSMQVMQAGNIGGLVMAALYTIQG